MRKLCLLFLILMQGCHSTMQMIYKDNPNTMDQYDGGLYSLYGYDTSDHMEKRRSDGRSKQKKICGERLALAHPERVIMPGDTKKLPEDAPLGEDYVYVEFYCQDKDLLDSYRIQVLNQNVSCIKLSWAEHKTVAPGKARIERVANRQGSVNCMEKGWIRYAPIDYPSLTSHLFIGEKGHRLCSELAQKISSKKMEEYDMVLFLKKNLKCH